MAFARAHSPKWESGMQSRKSHPRSSALRLLELQGQQTAAETALLIVCICKFFTSQFPCLQKAGIMMGIRSSGVGEMTDEVSEIP